MAQNPNWRRGIDLTSVTLQGLDVDPDTGEYTPGTTYRVTAYIDDLDHRVLTEFEDIRPVNNLQMNEVLTGIGNSVRVTEIKQKGFAAELNLVVQNYSYVLATWTEGIETFAGYFAVGELQSGIHGRGKQTAALDLHPTDPIDVAQVVRT